MLNVAPNQDNRSRILADGKWVALSQLGSVVGAVAFSIAAARTLGVEGFASIIWVLSAALFLGSAARLGSSQSAARIVSLSQGNTRTAIIRLIVGPLLCGLTASALWLAWLGDVVVNKSNDPELYRGVHVLVALWLPTVTVLPTLAATLRAIGAFKESTLLNDGLRRLTMTFVLLGAASTLSANLVTVAVIAAVIVETVAITIGLVLALRLTKNNEPPDRTPKQDLSETLGFLPNSIVALVIPQSGGWLLAFVAAPQAVADFGLAVQISMLFSLPFFIGSRVFVPRIAQAHTAGTLQNLERSLRSFATLSALIVTLATLAFGIVGKWLVPAVFGAEFEPAYTITLILAVGAFANAATGLAMAALSNTGSARLVSLSSVVAAIVFIPGTLILGSAFGAIGAAITASATQLVWNLIMLGASRQITGLNTSLTITGLPTRSST